MARSSSVTPYRRLDVSLSIFRERATRRLTMPVLSFCRSLPFGVRVERYLKPGAGYLVSVITPSCGYDCAEEKPKALLDFVLPFLTAG